MKAQWTSYNPTTGGGAPFDPKANMKDEDLIHYEFKVDSLKVAYIGSFFLTTENIEINFEKNEVDSLMTLTYPLFKKEKTCENYPEHPKKSLNL